MQDTTRHEQGFAMPVILTTSIAAVILMLALSQTIMSMRNMVNYSYYTKLAEESAEAGTVYASACFEANSRTQTWGNTSTNRLTQSSSCNGTQNTYAASTTGGSNASIPIRFTVGDIAVTPSSINIPAAGASTMPGASSPITGSLNRAITWRTDTTAQKSASGTSRVCGILSGNVYCWGNNEYGQLGNGVGTDGKPHESHTPVNVKKENGVMAGKQVTDMFAAQDHNCAIADGEVYCWGRNNYGQLGDGTTVNRPVPVKVSGLPAGVTEVGGTSFASCAIAGGKIYCWGNNTYGTVGKNTTLTSYTTPTLVATVADGVTNGLPSTYNATVLTSGSRSTNMCAIADGKAYCWGPNMAGQIGNNTANTIPDSTIYKAPVAVYTGGVLSGKTVTAISQDGYSDMVGSPSPPPYAHVCAVANGAIYCWGGNNSGQMGNGTSSSVGVKAPVAVSTSGILSGKTIVDVVSGISHSCALSSEGKVYCWGGNAAGQVGDYTSTTRKSPVSVSDAIQPNPNPNQYPANPLNGATVVAIAGGANRGCAIANQKSYCWGLNSEYQIGDGTNDDKHWPTEAVFLRPENNNYLY